MKTKIFICLGALLGVAALQQQVGWPLAKVTVHVLDEQEAPIIGAKVDIGFREKLSDQDARAVGETDSGGNFSAEGHSDKRLAANVRKEGFYLSGTGWTIFKDPVLGKWQPWNPTLDVILRPIGRPVAMHAKRAQGDVPVLDQPCGYDLEKGDWVSPHGKGKKSDLTFNVRRDYKDRNDFTLEAEVTFAQPLDGLVRMQAPLYARNSEFRWERSAPETGYTASHQISFISRKYPNYVDRKTSFDLEKTKELEQGYFLRVRTVEENGRIISANYGKITGDIVTDPRDSKTCYIAFTYYLNPTSLDRNLEWDTTKNLITGLRPEETPRGP